MENTLSFKEKKIVVSILKILGITNKFDVLDKINEFQEKDFELIRTDVTINMNEYMNRIFEISFNFFSSADLKNFKANFLQDSDL